MAGISLQTPFTPQINAPLDERTQAATKALRNSLPKKYTRMHVVTLDDNKEWVLKATAIIAAATVDDDWEEAGTGSGSGGLTLTSQLTGYVKATVQSVITATTTLLQSIGILEYKVDTALSKIGVLPNLLTDNTGNLVDAINETFIGIPVVVSALGNSTIRVMSQAAVTTAITNISGNAPLVTAQGTQSPQFQYRGSIYAYDGTSSPQFLIPQLTDLQMPVGSFFYVRQNVVGNPVTVAGASGVSITPYGGTLQTTGIYSTLYVQKIGLNTWIVQDAYASGPLATSSTTGVIKIGRGFNYNTSNGLLTMNGGVFKGAWLANTLYNMFDQVINPSGVLVYAIGVITSTTYAPDNWSSVPTGSSNAVILTTDQTINGTKTFTNGVRFSDGTIQTTAATGGSASGAVLLTTNQTVTGIKTFVSGITFNDTTVQTTASDVTKSYVDIADAAIFSEISSTSASLQASINFVKQHVVNTINSASYTLVLADAGKIVTFSAAATCTVPSGVFDTDTVIEVCSTTVGVVVVSPAAGVSLLFPPSGGLTVSEQYASVFLRHLGSNSWIVTGGIV